MQPVEIAHGPFRIGGATVRTALLDRSAYGFGFLILKGITFEYVSGYRVNELLLLHFLGKQPPHPMPPIAFCCYGPGRFTWLQGTSDIVNLGDLISIGNAHSAASFHDFNRYGSLAEFMHAWEDMTLPPPMRSRVVTQFEVEE